MDSRHTLLVCTVYWLAHHPTAASSAAVGRRKTAPPSFGCLRRARAASGRAEVEPNAGRPRPPRGCDGDGITRFARGASRTSIRWDRAVASPAAGREKTNAGLVEARASKPGRSGARGYRAEPPN